MTRRKGVIAALATVAAALGQDRKGEDVRDSTGKITTPAVFGKHQSLSLDLVDETVNDYGVSHNYRKVFWARDQVDRQGNHGGPRKQMTREFARTQIGRFAMLDRYPKTELAALSDLVDALLTAPSEDMAKAVVEHFLDSATSETRCPMASEIRNEINARQDEFRPNPSCQRCGGDGHIYGTRGGYTYAERCDCWARRPAPVYTRLVPENELREELAEALEKMKAKV